ncbi:peptidoglycan-binding protein [Streptomyces sp. NPDC051018]|uniref:peptidoglycan-binding protein n=1 Tax=Streptomyces sp. NPDC051018 TaxID=3365639 RepID=UPI0037BD6B3A
MTVPVFEEYEPAGDCDCTGCVQRRRALAAGGHPAAHGCRRALVLFTAAGVVLGGGGATGVAGAVEHGTGPVGLVDRPGPGPGAIPGSDRGTGTGTGPNRSSGAGSDQGAGSGRDPGPGSASGGDARSGAAGTGGSGAGAYGTGPGIRATPAGTTDPDNEQGGRGALHGRPLAGPSAAPAAVSTPKTTRAEIINRAKKWVNAKVPYSMSKYWSDGYRQDCSGYISMAWGLKTNEWTGSLARFATRISRDQLQPGDILLFHNPASPTKGSHATIFGGWTDYTRTYYVAYEQTKPATRKQATPIAYWVNSSKYVAYRYKGVTTATTPGPTNPDSYPGASSFRPGANNKHVTRLGQMLVKRGGKRFYSQGPGPRWGEADRKATQAFQKAQGWKGAEADGYPGPHTWKLLVTGKGKNIPAAQPAKPAPKPKPKPKPVAKPGAESGVVAPPFPGASHFRPGRSSAYVTQLGQQLVKRGFGKYYSTGPSPRWGEADRRNVEAFQRAQGWRGAEADGYPGPETWKRLFAK